jgi:hypothetical protein
VAGLNVRCPLGVKPVMEALAMQGPLLDAGRRRGTSQVVGLRLRLRKVAARERWPDYVHIDTHGV